MRDEESGLPCRLIHTEASGIAAQPRTVPIFGVARGGTTMVAGVARMCGLDIGADLPVNCEDPDFNLESLAQLGVSDPAAAIAAAVKRRNGDKPVWGWKYPHAVRYLAKIREELRNPTPIVVFRDVLATSGRLREESIPLLQTINAVMRTQRLNLDLIAQWNVPTLLVSYERAILRPHAFVAQLCEFLQADKPGDLVPILNYMKSGDYKPAPQVLGRGR